MTNAQLYFAIAVPVFAVIMGVSINNFNTSWQARAAGKRIDGLDKRIDGRDKRIDTLETRFAARFNRMDRTLEVIQNDLKKFYTDIAPLRNGLDYS